MNFNAIRKITILLAMMAGAAVVQAAPITYTMTVDGVTGTANGVAVGPGATTVIVVNADTTNVTVSGAGHCVLGTSGTIAITGINAGAPQALSGTYYVCANNIGDNVGIYPSEAFFTFGTPVHGGNTGAGSGALTGAPAVDLVSNLGPVSYIANTIHSHGGSGGTLSLAAGGTYVAFAPEAFGNTISSTFQAALTVTALTPIPTLSEWAMIVMSGLLALLGFSAMQKRQI